MKKLLGIVVLSLLLSGCSGGQGSEGGVLAALIGFIGIIFIAIVMIPFGTAMDKATKIKNDKTRHVVFIIILVIAFIVIIQLPGCLGTAMR